MSIRDMPGPAGIRWSGGRCPKCGARKGDTRAPGKANTRQSKLVTLSKAQLERWGDVLNQNPTDEEYAQVLHELFQAAGVPAFQGTRS